MAKTSPTKLVVFFVFFASFRIHKNLAPTSAFVPLTIPHNSSSVFDEGACQSPWKYVNAKVRRVEGSCDESDMESFENAVTCTRAFLLDHRPYHAATFVHKLHRHNAGKGGFFTDSLLTKLHLNPLFVDEVRRMGDYDWETVLDGYRQELALLHEGLDQLKTFEEIGFQTREEVELDEVDFDDDDDDDLNDDDDVNDDDNDDDENDVNDDDNDDEDVKDDDNDNNDDHNQDDYEDNYDHDHDDNDDDDTNGEFDQDIEVYFLD